MNRRRFLACAAGAGAAAAGAAAGLGLAVAGPRRPVSLVLMIVADSLRGDVIGKAIGGREVTPNINAFARENVLFRSAMSAAPWTKPSVASIMSGTYPAYHGVHGPSDTLPPVETIQSYLAARGFYTAAVHANPYLDLEKNAPTDGVGPGEIPFGFSRAFDMYYFKRPADGQTRARDELLAQSFESTWGNLLPSAGRDKAYVYLHFMGTHLPWLLEAPTDFTGVFHAKRGATREETYKSDAALLERLFPEGVFTPDLSDLSAEEREQITAIYHEAAAQHDSVIGRLLRYLKETGAYDRSIVVFTADHGDELGERGKAGHGHSLYNELLHVPLIVRLPGCRAAAVDARVSNAGIFAMLRDYFDGAVEGEMPPDSLLPWARLARRDHSLVHASWGERGKVILPNGLEVMETGGGTLLFDITGDPGEHAPLEPRPDAQRELADLRRFLTARAAVDGVERMQTMWKWQLQNHAGRAAAKDDPERDAQLRALGYLN